MLRRAVDCQQTPDMALRVLGIPVRQPRSSTLASSVRSKNPSEVPACTNIRNPLLACAERGMVENNSSPREPGTKIIKTIAKL
jgi:hypothetical protein